MASVWLPAAVPEPPPVKRKCIPHKLFIKLTVEHAKGCQQPVASEQGLPWVMTAGAPLRNAMAWVK